MADTIGSLIDKLATVNQKMFMAQEDLYIVRKMSLEEFKTAYGNEEGMEKLYNAFKKSMDLNVQRQAMILEVDKKIAEIVAASVKGEDLNNGTFIQDQHKTY
jgi:ssDNA-specific exonuclease RecJ